MRKACIAGLVFGLALGGCSSNNNSTDGGGSTDSGPPDAGGMTDAGPTDSGMPDSGTPDSGVPDSGAPDAGPPDAGPPDAGQPDSGPALTTQSSIQHLVVIIQENHTFDSYFGQYCTAPTNSAPTCTSGPQCCEQGPAMDPSGASPVVLTDAENGTYSPNHNQNCELPEIDDGGMDKYVSGAGSGCSSPHNFAYATSVVQPYWTMAGQGALADNYFQSVAGASSSNDMYFARASFVFVDNSYAPQAKATLCDEKTTPVMDFQGPTIGDLMNDAGVSWGFYAEGYADSVAAWEIDGGCPAVPADCAWGFHGYPCNYDPTDVPFLYYASIGDSAMRDLGQLTTDLSGGTLPSVVYVKGLGYHTEHPFYKDTITAGETFVSGVVSQIQQSSYASSTLILVTPDESGGYFDHISPPPMSSVDMQEYGPRIWMLALGPFVTANTIAHIPMEHSSVVKFIEWNWLGGVTGQLGERDTVVNNIGSLLNPAATGTTVPLQ